MKNEKDFEGILHCYRENLELEEQIETIKEKIEQNHRSLIEAFFPYLLTVYEKWRPSLGEKAVHIDFERNYHFEVTVRKVDGYHVRTQEGDSNCYISFELNPDKDIYEVPGFIIPMWSFDEIKHLFQFIKW
ncbi:MAG: hypothetical protein GY757_58385 [bacterium]|nr:hypothetical protein [bacterium]